MADEQKPVVREWRKFAKLTPKSTTLTKRARKIESTTLRHAHKFIIKRWVYAQDVKRHIVGWMVLVSLLIIATALQGGWWYPSTYSTEAAALNTTYAEGVVGRLDTVNPLYATSAAEVSASKLMFSSLLSYDNSNKLRGELAADWQAIDGGEAYIVKLRPDLKWHDGKQITADDVVFTVSLMKAPIVNSRFIESWADIEVEKIDKLTVRFDLPGKYIPFPHALVFGVLPKHLLKDTPLSQIGQSDFAKNPVGSGPFEFIDRQIIDPNSGRLVLKLKANPSYFRGEPRLKRFQLHIYGSVVELKQAFLSGQVNAVVSGDLASEDLAKLSSVRDGSRVYTATLNNGVFAFFNLDNDLLDNQQVRRALVRATDRPGIIKQLHGKASPLSLPVLDSQYAVDTSLAQAEYNTDAAKKLLTKEGWKINDKGVRFKNDKPLQLNLVAPNTGDYPIVANAIAKQWSAVGISVKVKLVEPDTVVQDVLIPRQYDVLLYQLALGAGPDQYAYWHSTQANGDGYNLSNYQSEIADAALSTARTKAKPGVRAEKYNTFAEQWVKDAPAVALYQPTLHYLATERSLAVQGKGQIVNQADRYKNVIYWSLGTRDVHSTP